MLFDAFETVASDVAAFKEQSKQKNAKKASDQRKRKAAEKRTAERAASAPCSTY